MCVCCEQPAVKEFQTRHLVVEKPLSEETCPRQLFQSRELLMHRNRTSVAVAIIGQTGEAERGLIDEVT